MAQPVARQADFDALVAEAAADGQLTWEEAAREALDTFAESGYDVSGLFLYTSKQGFETKSAIERSFRVMEEVAAGKETLVNMTFAIQGLMQNLRGGHVLEGAKRLFEQRKGFHTIVAVLKQISALEAGEEEKDTNGEDSDSDSEDDFMYYRGMVFEVFHTLLGSEFQGRPSSFRNVEELLLVSEEEAAFLAALIEHISEDDKMVFGLLLLVSTIMKVPASMEIFKATTSFFSALDLAQKMNKKQTMVVAQVASMLSQLN